MKASTPSFELTGVVPSVCDAEAGEEHPIHLTDCRVDPSTRNGSSTGPPAGAHKFSTRRIQSALAKVYSAMKRTIDADLGVADDCLRRVDELLQEIGEAEPEQAEG
jgi:hypothetical protein